MITNYRLTSILDKCAVSTSAVCAIHCLSLPILLAVFPAVGATFFGDEHFHEMLLWAVVPMTVISLSIGCKKHKDKITAALGAMGLTVLVFTGIMGHDGLTKLAETILTLIGATIIASAHIRNHRMCRKSACAS